MFQKIMIKDNGSSKSHVTCNIKWTLLIPSFNPSCHMYHKTLVFLYYTTSNFSQTMIQSAENSSLKYKKSQLVGMEHLTGQAQNTFTHICGFYPCCHLVLGQFHLINAVCVFLLNAIVTIIEVQGSKSCRECHISSRCLWRLILRTL